MMNDSNVVCRGSIKILLVIETSHGGSGMHVIELAEFLSQLGHDVHVIYSPIRMDKKFQADLSQLRSVKSKSLRISRNMNMSDLTNVIEIRRYMVTHGPFDVIHGHSSKGGALARLASLFYPAARIYTPHAFITLDPTASVFRHGIYRIAEYFLARFATETVIVVSENELAHALRLGISSKKIVLIPPGIRKTELPSRDIVRSFLGLRSDAFCIGWIGRYVPQKAVERVIQGAAQILSDRPDVRLILLGHGPLEAQMRHLAAALNVDDQIVWLKNFTGEDIISALDVFVLTSLYEGMPRVILEALVAGVPVVAMDCGGVRMAVRSGINGFVVPAGDLEAFVQGLRELVRDQELRNKMSISARNSAQSFSIEKMTRDILHVYYSHLRRHQKRLSKNAPASN